MWPGEIRFFNELLPAFFDEFYANMKPMYDFSHENVKFQQKKKHETLFRQIEKTITKDVHVTLLTTNIPIYFHCSFFPNR